MDYEKKYNDALNLAKSYYGKGSNEFLDTMFPEFRESEDEEIRKHIIDLIKDNAKAKSIPCDAEIAYLEKQREIPLMNGDADLYFDEWNQQKPNPTKRQCFEEGMKYAQRLQKEQEHICDSAHMRNDSNR